MATHEIKEGQLAGWTLRIRAGKPEARETDTSRWIPAPLRLLARHYPAGEGPWPWLAEHGVRRPSPSGTRGYPSQSDEARRANGRVRLPTIWFATEEHEALERLRQGRSVRDTLAAVILAAEKRAR